MAKLEDKVAIVTGGGSGIGQASAILMAKEGARVVIVDINEKSGKEVQAEIIKDGGKAIFFQADVSQPKEVEAMVLTGVQEYGRLDILFNNAGMSGNWKYTADLALEEWQKVINTNLTGYFLAMKYAIPVMIKSGGGSIINNSSTAAIKTRPGASDYGTTKAGVVMLTKTAAVEYGPQKIRVNTIQPGVVLTQLFQRALEATQTADEALKSIPIGRFGQPEDVANLVLFLASNDSSYVTGATILIDGGFTAG